MQSHSHHFSAKILGRDLRHKCADELIRDIVSRMHFILPEPLGPDAFQMLSIYAYRVVSRYCNCGG